MHDSAKAFGFLFFDTYSEYFTKGETTPIALEIGVGTDKTLENKAILAGFNYHGIDQIHTDNPDDVYTLPFADGSVDVVVSSSCFEHDFFFWITFLEIMRVLKPNGLFYLNAPSKGGFHRYPLDCYRFYPDAGAALVKWGKKNRMDVHLLETFTDLSVESWKDYVAVFLKDESRKLEYKKLMTDSLSSATIFKIDSRGDYI
jgi:SAM-dependent methyltransferase